ncbi:hypothetical protein OSTOST_06146 [Ostertagia ostertagi]
MVDLCKVVSGLELSPEAEEAMASYSDDLLDALIDVICLETKQRGAYRINENDALNSVKAVSFFPARVLKAKPDVEASPCSRPTAGTTQSSQTSKLVTRPRKPVIDEARFLEDIRKMKPKDTREPQTYYSHKMTLEAKDLRPKLGPAAIAEATAAMERPARHFVGRPQPLITEDRGCVQPELTTYNRYRNYLGIVGPMPNIKPNVGPLTKLPAYLQALQQRNEMLGLASGGNIPRQGPPQPRQMNRPQQPVQAAPLQQPYQYPAQQPVMQQPVMQPPQNIPMPGQRREKWVDELERSALMSPTPPLTECDYPLCRGGDHYHCVLSRKSADMTLPLTVESTEMPSETPACTRELTPPDNNVWEPLEGPVDHVDCAEYYMRVNSGVKTKKSGSEGTKSVDRRVQENKQSEPVAEEDRHSNKKLVLPKPPAIFQPKRRNCLRNV